MEAAIVLVTGTMVEVVRYENSILKNSVTPKRRAIGRRAVADFLRTNAAWLEPLCENCRHHIFGMRFREQERARERDRGKK